MPKITVETKSRSKHVFETDEDSVEKFTKIIQTLGFSKNDLSKNSEHIL